MSLSNLILKCLLWLNMIFSAGALKTRLWEKSYMYNCTKYFLSGNSFNWIPSLVKFGSKKCFFFLHRRFVYHIWNHWFADVGPETVREIANSQERNGDCNTDNINRTSRQTSPSIIPSLLELASSSFKILTESKSRSRLKTPMTDGTFLPLSTSSEFKFCDGVIAECKGPEGEVQRSCALNYKRWLLIRSTPHQLNCNGAPFTPKVVKEPGLS